MGASTVTLTVPSFVQDKKKLTLIAGGLTLLVATLGILVAMKPSKPITTAAAPLESKTDVTPATETKAPEPAKPESKVLSPAPSPAVVPPGPAPADKGTSAKGEVGKAEPPKTVAATTAAKPGEAAKAEPGKGEPGKTDATKLAAANVPPATLVFAVSPWGEIFVNGKSRGVTPPMKSLKLEPGKYKIEVRNTTFPAHTESLELKARDEVTVRHRFQ
jgi:hypothetical protein